MIIQKDRTPKENSESYIAVYTQQDTALIRNVPILTPAVEGADQKRLTTFVGSTNMNTEALLMIHMALDSIQKRTCSPETSIYQHKARVHFSQVSRHEESINLVTGSTESARENTGQNQLYVFKVQKAET